MSGDGNGWKKHLLRTSVPLEHEAALILSSNGFSVSADYSYSRLDAGIEKEFSVDVRGVIGTGPADRFQRECLMDVLIECKYRDRGTTWLFLPQPKYPTCKLSEGLQSVDLFSPKFVHDLWLSDNLEVPECYSAVEVGSARHEDEKAKGRALESQLKHGLRQLQYALPSLIMLRARVAALIPVEENFPFFFAPILVTNATLVVAHASFGIESVEAAQSLADVGNEVPCLIWTADVGPDFYQHCQRQLAPLVQFVGTPSMRTIEARRKAAREASWLLPSVLAQRIAVDSTDSIHLAEFKNVIVVNVAHLAGVLAYLSRVLTHRAETLKDEPVVKW